MPIRPVHLHTASQGGQMVSRMPTINTRRTYYNRGMAWTTTATPPTANLASVQLADSSTRRPGAAPSPTPVSEPPSSPDIEDDELALTTTETSHPEECGHTDAYSQTCRKVDVDHTVVDPVPCVIHTQHWINDHVMRELQHIQRGSLDIGLEISYPGPRSSSPTPTFSGQRRSRWCVLTDAPSTANNRGRSRDSHICCGTSWRPAGRTWTIRTKNLWRVSPRSQLW
ncbi:hypothetical protein JB92DRAFT_846689 [Gautieria morchelliformis]|nr:hypothetical protein JB92DRAFT_846689 [Gautieria morchelliformis]